MKKKIHKKIFGTCVLFFTRTHEFMKFSSFFLMNGVRVRGFFIFMERRAIHCDCYQCFEYQVRAYKHALNILC
jgi:hypothetical protein